MDSLSLERFQRIARNLPPLRMNQAKAETEFGPVYIAWGDYCGAWHGAWATRGTAQTLQFKRGTDEADVKAHLIECAMIWAGDMRRVGLFNFAGRGFGA